LPRENKLKEKLHGKTLKQSQMKKIENSLTKNTLVL